MHACMHTYIRTYTHLHAQKEDESSIPVWQETILLIGLTALLVPLFLFTLADPMKPPTTPGALSVTQEEMLSR
jgi:hypothetical protein